LIYYNYFCTILLQLCFVLLQFVKESDKLTVIIIWRCPSKLPPTWGFMQYRYSVCCCLTHL